GPLAAGHARPIATGAPTPSGAVGVLRTEHGVVADGLLQRGPDARADEPRVREHIRPAGEESAAGEILITAGAVLTPPRLALAAVAGHDLLTVRERPVVDLAFLGDEVVTRGIPSPGSVRDAYGVQLPGLITSLGADVGSVERVPDRLDATVDALRAGHGRLLICTGGTARGASDHLRAALEAAEAELELDGIAMRPGHPTMLARLDDERAVLCLPGNPMAAMVAFIVLGVPLLDGMLGRPAALQHDVELAVDLAGARVTRFVAYRREPAGAVPTQRQGSGMLRGLADAEGLLIVPIGGAHRGERIAALPLPW
ncbi:molybdopterin molybdenumtransferase MoeA, partial [Agromyces sp. ISL-38]|uniref:molybdopterin-binding protein n=1 Tax=Agromyces sp. ISL-38 TaxID=2819107 RepID=UPI001BE4F29F